MYPRPSNRLWLWRADPMAGNRMSRLWSRVQVMATGGWSLLRRLSGDDAYDRYLKHMQLSHASTPPLSAQEFLRQQTEQKWSRISRCC